MFPYAIMCTIRNGAIRCREWWSSTGPGTALSLLSMCVCVANVSNQISQYDSKSCKLLVHGINKTVTVKRANEQTREKKIAGLTKLFLVSML